jgi:hypothetical protein
LVAGNVTVNSTGTAAAATVVVAGTGQTRTVTLSDITGNGTLGISVAANTASDVAGNHAPAAGPSTTFIVDTTNDAPTITGAVAGQTVNDNATVSPFSGVTIGDSDQPAQSLTVTVALDTAAKGTFTTLNGFTDAGGGSYTFTGTADDATTAIRGLVFAPADNRGLPGTTETTTFTITVNDGQATPVTNNTTTVISTSINDPPVAGADSITRHPGAAVKVAISQLLSNDTDPENETLSLDLPSAISVNGGLLNIEGRWLIYTPPGNNNADTFEYTLHDGSGGTATGTVSVTVQADTAQSKNSLSIVSDGDDKVLTFIGIPGVDYQIQYTTDLSGTPTWTTLSTQTAGTNGLFQYRDVNPPPPARFYRTFAP